MENNESLVGLVTYILPMHTYLDKFVHMLLLYLSNLKHVTLCGLQLHGYTSPACTSMPCEWNQEVAIGSCGLPIYRDNDTPCQDRTG